MIVCSCFGITDGDLRDAGRSDAAFAAGTCCGSCLPLVSDIVRQRREDETGPPDREPPPSSTDIADRA